MRTSLKAALIAGATIPLALAGPVVAFASPTATTSIDCFTQTEHDTWASKATSYTAEQRKHQANLAAQNDVVAAAKSAVTSAQGTADDLAAQVKAANASKNTALADIEYRQGLIAAMKAKLPGWQAKVETARDNIGKAQSDYRKAKNAGDQAGMDAAQAAATAERAKLAEAERQVVHYTQGQVSAQGHIDRSQKAVDEATALGKRLYPQYQAQLGEVTRLTSVLNGEQAKIAGLEKKVADIAQYLATAQANAAKGVCEDVAPEPEPEPEPVVPAPGPGAGGDSGTPIEGSPSPAPEEPAPVSSAAPAPQQMATAGVVGGGASLLVPATVATAKKANSPAKVTQPARKAAAGAQGGGGGRLASTGTNGDALLATALAGIALVAGGFGVVRKGRHAR